MMWIYMLCLSRCCLRIAMILLQLKHKELYATITLKGYVVNFKLDRGAEVNTLPLKIFND